MADFKDRSQLVTMALEELGAIEAGQTPESEDFQKVDSYVDGLLAELRVRNVATVDDDDEIPIEWTRSLAMLLADECPVPFGKSKLAPQERRLIEQRLRSMAAARVTGEPLKTVYY